VAYELIPMYTPIPKGRQLNVNYKSWIAYLLVSLFLSSRYPLRQAFRYPDCLTDSLRQEEEITFPKE